MGLNKNCRLAGNAVRNLHHDCSDRCPYWVKPDARLKAHGFICAYQKQGNLMAFAFRKY